MSPDKPDYGWEIHAMVAAVGGAWLGLGYLREVFQHGSWTLTKHQLTEALAWPAGWFAAVTLVLLAMELLKWARRGED